MLLGIHLKRAILLFSRDILNSLHKLLSPKLMYVEDEKGPLNLKAIRYALALVITNICISRQRSDFLQILKIQDLQINSNWYPCIHKKHSPSTSDSKWEYHFQIIKFLSSHSAVLESTLTGKSRKDN